MPKIYFVDTGLLAYLFGIDSESRFFRAAEKESLFENMIVMEIVKRFSVCKGKTDFFFYRTQAGLSSIPYAFAFLSVAINFSASS